MYETPNPPGYLDEDGCAASMASLDAEARAQFTAAPATTILAAANAEFRARASGATATSTDVADGSGSPPSKPTNVAPHTPPARADLPSPLLHIRRDGTLDLHICRKLFVNRSTGTVKIQRPGRPPQSRVFDPKARKDFVRSLPVRAGRVRGAHVGSASFRPLYGDRGRPPGRRVRATCHASGGGDPPGSSDSDDLDHAPAGGSPTITI